MAEAQYQPEPDIFIEPDDIPPATPGPVAAKFDQNDGTYQCRDRS